MITIDNRACDTVPRVWDPRRMESLLDITSDKRESNNMSSLTRFLPRIDNRRHSTNPLNTINEININKLVHNLRYMYRNIPSSWVSNIILKFTSTSVIILFYAFMHTNIKFCSTDYADSYVVI